MAFVVILLALCAVCVPLALGARFGVLPLLSPMHLVGYFCALGFLAKVVVYPARPDWAFYARFVDAPEALLVGAVYLALFVFGICAGYLLAVNRRSTNQPASLTQISASKVTHPNVLFALAILVAACTFLAILRARGMSLSGDVLLQLNSEKQIDVSAAGVGATLAGVKTLFVVPKCAFVLLLAYGLSRGDRRALWQAMVLAGLLVFVALVSGDRFELVELLVYTVLTYLLVGGRNGLGTVLRLGVACAAVLVLSAYMTALRGSADGLVQQIIGSTYFLDVNAAVMVTSTVAPHQMLWGESYSWWGFGWVPRVWWPDKPAVDLGVYFKRDVMGVMTGGAFNVTGPGEAFINFGWWGLGVAPVIGAFYRWVEVWLLSATQLLSGGWVVYPLIFYPFIQATLQSSFSAFVVGAAAQLLLICLMISVFLPRYRLATHEEVAHGV